MWISQQINSGAEQPVIQVGKVTLNSNNQMEAASTSAQRSVQMFSPMGYSYAVPAGSSLVLAESDGEQVALGIPMDNSTLKTGEIKIANQQGAYIYLRADGCVEINGLVIGVGGQIYD